MQISQKRKIFSHFFLLNFLNLDSIFRIFKKITLMADVFLNLQSPKDVVCLESAVSEDPSTSNSVNGH